ncbi:MAG TPA: SDR family NAD(P)-dependent oxidoreductase [Pyrinomonadaceae bacterium]|jgi:short-subunit dehydrogenase|nr:SDR family NAD(P)-dependent oxidoreductase [Pyrinomonadaceae bacterium]
MGYDWQNTVVFLTGASSGIGRALALELGRRGARVGLLARRVEELMKVAEEVEAAGGKALALPADVRQAEDVRRAAERVRETWGRVDILIANAGMSTTTAATALRADEAGDVISVNVIGVVNSVAAVLPDMIEKKRGHLVAISSLAAYRGLPKSGAYSASKAAVSTLFESLRLDLRQSGVDVTVIHPGFIRTPMTADRKTKLPFLLEVDDAACRILRAIERRARTYAFPWQLASVVRVIRHIPGRLYDSFASRRSFRD